MQKFKCKTPNKPQGYGKSHIFNKVKNASQLVSFLTSNIGFQICVTYVIPTLHVIISTPTLISDTRHGIPTHVNQKGKNS